MCGTIGWLIISLPAVLKALSDAIYILYSPDRPGCSHMPAFLLSPEGSVPMDMER